MVANRNFFLPSSGSAGASVATRYLRYLQPLHLFETAGLSAEDEERTKLYQKDQQRSVERHQYADEGAFLASLNMGSTVLAFNRFNGPRVAQLSQRSNQRSGRVPPRAAGPSLGQSGANSTTACRRTR